MNLPGVNYEEALERMVGNEELLIMVLTAVVDDIESSADLFTGLVQSGQYEEAYKLAHRSKGLAANSSATLLFDSLSECCKACLAEDADKACKAFAVAHLSAGALKKALSEAGD